MFSRLDAAQQSQLARVLSSAQSRLSLLCEPPGPGNSCIPPPFQNSRTVPDLRNSHTPRQCEQMLRLLFICCIGYIRASPNSSTHVTEATGTQQPLCKNDAPKRTRIAHTQAIQDTSRCHYCGDWPAAAILPPGAVGNIATAMAPGRKRGSHLRRAPLSPAAGLARS